MSNLPARPQKPPCPNCGTKLQIKCLADDWGEIFGKWRYCEKCGFDERDARSPQENASD